MSQIQHFDTPACDSDRMKIIVKSCEAVEAAITPLLYLNSSSLLAIGVSSWLVKVLGAY
jgi:hypothetical protein